MAKLVAFLLVFATAIIYTDADGQRTLSRQKREWIVPPMKLKENVDYTRYEYIAKIRSDEETRTTIRYFLEGPGANEDPVGLFTVDSKLGLVKIHGILDRETTPVYTLRGVAKFLNGSRAEKDIDMRIRVEDDNDCIPRFNIAYSGDVYELSQIGTFIIHITAQDDDEAGTPNSQIAYSITGQYPAGNMMFYVDQGSGRIYARTNTLDREVQESFKLTIIGADLNGQKGGNTGTGTLTINVLDVNDNVPTLEKDFYLGSVEENSMNIEVIRIQAIDLDKIHTDNWRAVFTIIAGNEAGYFTITTDNITNEGVVMLNKEIDYEELKEINLKVTVSNVAKYHSSVVNKEPLIYPIKISVVNQPEGPRFRPSVKVISISEDKTTINLKKIIATYTAIDSDTMLIATNVRYVKGQDLDNWLIIDEKTADIRLNKLPDRESKFLINGTYYAKILCITEDHPSKTATGTIAIQVEDFNDHCPVLTNQKETICYEENVVYVTATDGDEFPNAEPFLFKVVSKDSKVKWTVEHLNDTTAILRGPEHLWPGHYTVELEVQDQQGKFCEKQVLYIDMCKCDVNKVCTPRKLTDTSTTFGAAGVLAMLLGLLLLLLIPLLLIFCLCGMAAVAENFKPFPSDQTQHLITYHTEGQGEDKDVPLLEMPTELGVVGGHNHGQLGSGGGKWSGGLGAGGEHGYFDRNEAWHGDQHDSSFINGQYHKYHQHNIKGQTGLTGMGALEGIALSEAFLGSYYLKKANYMSGQQAQGDSLLVYASEGMGSRQGSLEDICGHLYEEDNNLAFLNNLGPQFRTLAQLCSGSSIEIGAATATMSTTTATKPKVPKPVEVGTSSLDFRAEGSTAVAGGAASTSVSASTSSSTSTTHFATTDYRESRGVSQVGTLAQTAQVPGQTLLIQQPTLYYVVEPQPQPTLLVATGPVMGLQENMVLVDQRGADVIVPNPIARPRQGLKQTQTKMLVEAQTGNVAQGLLGMSQDPASASGVASSRFVKTERLHTVEPLNVLQGSWHSGVGGSHSRQVSGQNGGMDVTRFVELRGASGSTDSLETPQFESQLLTLPHGGAQHKVREERISVVEKSFQSSSST